MTTRIEIQPSEEIQTELAAKVQTWAKEVLEKNGPLAAPPFISINIWRRMDELQSFYQQEKQELGVVTGEETEFLATHEAWRGHPRIHICQERVKDVSHGTPEFYTFRYSIKLQEAGRFCGLDLALLQQCVYMLSVTLKLISEASL